MILPANRKYPKRDPLPDVIYASWEEAEDLYRLRFLDAVSENPEKWFATEYTEVAGVYRLTDTLVIPPKNQGNKK